MTGIPTSGAFLRAFAGASMTAGTRHVAEVIAASISYDGKYRGAPKGHAAFTMAELQSATGLAARTVQIALKELAALFGLLICKRHRQRHFFRFTRIGAQSGRATPATEVESEGEAQTRSPVRVTPYIEKQRDNDCSTEIRVGAAGNVWKTPWASLIERLKRGTPAEKVDTQFLWNGFCGLNRRNGHQQVPLRFLIGFLRKYPKARQAASALSVKPVPPVAVPQPRQSLIEMARPAPFENRHFHRSDLRRRIGDAAYEARVNALIACFGASRFTAELAVHGEAVRQGEIDG